MFVYTVETLLTLMRLINSCKRGSLKDKYMYIIKEIKQGKFQCDTGT